MPNGIYLADIVVRVYKDHTHDERLAAQNVARDILRKPSMNLDDAERDVLERVRRGELAVNSPEVSFSPSCFVTVRGERHLLDDLNDEDRAHMPLNSFQAEFFRELGRVKARLSKQRAQRYLSLGGTLDAFVMDTPLWDYVRERVSHQLGVGEAESRLLMFVRRAAEDRSPPLDPVANELTRLDRENFTDELLRDIWRLYPVQAVDLKLDKPTEEPGKQQQPPGRGSSRATEKKMADASPDADDGAQADIQVPAYPSQGDRSEIVADVQPIALDDEEMKTLEALYDARPRLLTTYDLEPRTHISRKTVSSRLNRLIKLKLAERPKGPNGGAMITTTGIRLLEPLKLQHSPKKTP